MFKYFTLDSCDQSPRCPATKRIGAVNHHKLMFQYVTKFICLCRDSREWLRISVQMYKGEKRRIQGSRLANHEIRASGRKGTQQSCGSHILRRNRLGLHPVRTDRARSVAALELKTSLSLIKSRVTLALCCSIS